MTGGIHYTPNDKKLLFCKTLEGCYSVSNGHAVFKLVFKLVLFCKTLEGCYSVSIGHADFLSWHLFHIGKRH